MFKKKINAPQKIILLRSFLKRSITFVCAAVIVFASFLLVPVSAAENVTDLTLNIKYKIWCNSNDEVYAEKSYDVDNNEAFSHTVIATSTNLNYAVYTSNTFTVGTADGSIIAKAGEKLNFRLDNIVTSYNIGYADGAASSHDWKDPSIVSRVIYLINTDGTWTTYKEGQNIKWNYSSGNNSHNVSVDIVPDKDVIKIQYYEYVNVYDVTKFFGYSQSFILSGSYSNPLKVTIDKQSEEAGLLEGIGNQVDQLPDKIGDEMQGVIEQEKQESQGEGNKFVDQILGALPDPSQGVLAALGDLTGAVGYTGTDAKLTIPALVLPGIDGLFSEFVIWEGTEFSFSDFLGFLPPTLLTVVQSLFTIAIVLFCVYEIKGIISYCFTLRESKGG